MALPALRDGEEVVRATAAASVVFLPSSEAAGALLPLLGDKAAFVRKEAAYALGTVGDASATSALVSMLNDKDLEVRSAAARALGGIGDPAAISPLMSILRRSPGEDTEFIRRSVARSIGQIAQIVHTGVRGVVTPRNFLPPKYKDIRTVSTVQTAVPLFDVAGRALLRVFQDKRESEDTRREAAFALGALRYGGAEPALAEASSSPDPYLAEICKEALLKLRSVE